MPRYLGGFLTTSNQSGIQMPCSTAWADSKGALNWQQHPLCWATLYALLKEKKQSTAFRDVPNFSWTARKAHACQLSLLCFSSVVAGAIWRVFPSRSLRAVCLLSAVNEVARTRRPLGKSRAMNRPGTRSSGCSVLSPAFAVPPALTIVPLLNNGLSLWSYCYSQCQKQCLSFWQSSGVLLCCPQWQEQVLRSHKNVQKVNE